MIKELKPAFLMLMFITIMTGVIYPAAVTGLAQALFSKLANGSLIENNGQVVGSNLIGQEFTDPKYFWGRPSATAPMPYNASASSGSNLGPTNPALEDAVKARIERLKASDPVQIQPIPVDLVTTSASGLDPHISPAAANWQVPRIARLRGIPQEQVQSIVKEHTQGRQLGFLGEPGVNVLELNLALDKATKSAQAK